MPQPAMDLRSTPSHQQWPVLLSPTRTLGRVVVDPVVNEAGSSLQTRFRSSWTVGLMLGNFHLLNLMNFIAQHLTVDLETLFKLFSKLLYNELLTRLEVS